MILSEVISNCKEVQKNHYEYYINIISNVVHDCILLY